MSGRQYIAIIRKSAESDYGVSFPDLPGCVTAGRTLDEARTFAEEALALHVEGMKDDGETIPEPSSLEAIMGEAENRDGVAILVAEKKGAVRSVRANITLPEDVLSNIDAYAARHGMSRSGFLVQAARRQMEDSKS